ncbi:DUF1415 domain-containing protein [Halomonas shantousis]
MPDSCYVQATRDWVRSFVVAHNVCPFAGREVRRDSIRYVVCAARDPQAALLALIDECRHLDSHATVETTLLILPHGMEDFEDYLDLLEVAEALLVDQGYEGVYQLASFHPDYCFADTAAEDPANYTNRSPYPMLHLLREAGLERVLAHFPHPERIPEANQANMRKLGDALLAEQLQRCHHAAEK